MNYRIIWSHLKDGYKGFERLAVLYVQRNYDSRFQHTEETRDGNTDARLIKNEFTIVMGFQRDEEIAEEWWMEAKFSESKARLTRYRLDATLVSAILSGNVGRVIFVTNINVDMQTVNDVRQAITLSTKCKEVDFCTKDRLEYWLYQNPDVLADFFANYHNEPIELPRLMLIEQMDFYAADTSGLVFRESLRILEMEHTYIARFAVYVHEAQEFSIRAGSHLKGLVDLRPRKLRLNAGVNELEISFKLSSGYGYKNTKQAERHYQLPTPAFQMETLNIVPRKAVTVSKYIWKNYRIPSQENVLKTLKRRYSKFQNDRILQLLYVSGPSAVGKSYVLDTFTESVSQSDTLLFTCEMSENQQKNIQNLARCLDFIYFPFLPIDCVSTEYLDCLKGKQFFSRLYYDIVSHNWDSDTRMQLFSRYITEDISLFPRRLYVDPRLIIIDNVHKANDILINSIYKMILELSTINAPFMFILVSQKVRHTSAYMELKKTVPVAELQLGITATDCLALLPQDWVSQEVQRLFESGVFFSNMMELLYFVEYLLDHGAQVPDFNSFAMLYHLFFHEHIMDIYIGRLFNNATGDDADADVLCNQIYWNSQGVDGVELPAGQWLLSCHVAKIDSVTGRLVPYHDIYTSYYRKNYNHRGYFDVPFITIMDSADINAQRNAIGRLHQAYKDKQYIFVYYSLEPVFQDTETLSYRDLLNDTDYFSLFYEYASSCAFCSSERSGQKLFKRIYEETVSLLNPTSQIRLICNAALWELTNSTFESLKFQAAKDYASELIRNTSDLLKRGILHGKLKSCVRYHNANVICSLIKSELMESDSKECFMHTSNEILNNGFHDRYWSYQVRYSLTLMQRAPRTAMDILAECCTHYDEMGNNDEKYLLWSHFYLAYMKMIVDDHYAEEADALSFMQRLHDLFFNDYQKTMYGMITYFYYRGDIEHGDSLMLSDSYVLRPKRPRLQGFSYLANALRDVVTGNVSNAVGELEKAAQIFCDIPSYAMLIRHNVSVLQDGDFGNQNIHPQIKYYFGGALERHTYYLDIRCCW